MTAVYLSLHGAVEVGLLVPVLEGLRVSLSLGIYSQLPAPIPEARKLGSSAQSANTGARCTALLDARAALCHLRNVFRFGFFLKLVNPGGIKAGKGMGLCRDGEARTVRLQKFLVLMSTEAFLV